MFHDLAEGAPNAREAASASIAQGLSMVERVLPDALLVDEAAVWQSDCVLAPVLFGVQGVLGAELIAPHPRLAAYLGRAAQKPAVARVLGELTQALAAQQATEPA